MSAYEVDIQLSQPRAFLEPENPALVPKVTLPAVTSDFLERRFRNAPLNTTWILNLAVESSTPEGIAQVQGAIAAHYAQQIESTLHDLRNHWRDTIRAFVYGGLFLGACLGLHQLLTNIFDARFPRILDEGLIIIGWVAMWRPAELLTYDWVPLVRRLKLQRKLAQLSVKAI